MGRSLREKISHLQQAIAAREGLRPVVGDAVVDTAVAAGEPADIFGKSRRRSPLTAGPSRSSSAVASTSFGQSLAIFKRLNAPGEQATTLREWARSELAHGDQARGRVMWREARSLFRELGQNLEGDRMDKERHMAEIP
jgi:hypothetical protein